MIARIRRANAHNFRPLTSSIKENLAASITNSINRGKKSNGRNHLLLHTQSDKSTYLSNIIRSKLGYTTTYGFIHRKVKWIHRQSKSILKQNQRNPMHPILRHHPNTIMQCRDSMTVTIWKVDPRP